MTVDEFIAAQEQVIADGEFDDYLPTLWIEMARQVEVMLLTDAPDGEEIERVAGAWAQQMARKHDYCLAFKAGDSVARIHGVKTDRIVSVDIE